MTLYSEMLILTLLLIMNVYFATADEDSCSQFNDCQLKFYSSLQPTFAKVKHQEERIKDLLFSLNATNDRTIRIAMELEEAKSEIRSIKHVKDERCSPNNLGNLEGEMRKLNGRKRDYNCGRRTEDLEFITDCTRGHVCFLFSLKKATAAEAIRSCRSRNASLASVQSEEENYWLAKQVGTIMNTDWYIGAKRMRNRFINQDSSELCYSNWYTNEPNNKGGVESCVQMSRQGFWNDISCNTRAGYICERERSSSDVSNEPLQKIGILSTVATGRIGGCTGRVRAITCATRISDSEFVTDCSRGTVCFLFSLREANAAAAKRTCESRKGKLASVMSEEENDWLVKAARAIKKTWWYIGATRSGKGFLNTDGSPLLYSNWNGGQPDNWEGKENCVHFNVFWNDIGCNEKYSYICEVKRD